MIGTTHATLDRLGGLGEARSPPELIYRAMASERYVHLQDTTIAVWYNVECCSPGQDLIELKIDFLAASRNGEDPLTLTSIGLAISSPRNEIRPLL